MLSYPAFIMRFNPESSDVQGETLVLHVLCMLQDSPMKRIPQRQVKLALHDGFFDLYSWRWPELRVVFCHLVGTYRKTLLPWIDKLFDERVLLGTCLGANEFLRCAKT